MKRFLPSAKINEPFTIDKFRCHFSSCLGVLSKCGIAPLTEIEDDQQRVPSEPQTHS
jgi:hypothetical protein